MGVKISSLRMDSLLIQHTHALEKRQSKALRVVGYGPFILPSIVIEHRGVSDLGATHSAS